MKSYIIGVSRMKRIGKKNDGMKRRGMKGLEIWEEKYRFSLNLKLTPRH